MIVFQHKYIVSLAVSAVWGNWVSPGHAGWSAVRPGRDLRHAKGVRRCSRARGNRWPAGSRGPRGRTTRTWACRRPRRRGPSLRGRAGCRRPNREILFLLIKYFLTFVYATTITKFSLFATTYTILHYILKVKCKEQQRQWIFSFS